jgi:hypothetical protein
MIYFISVIIYLIVVPLLVGFITADLAMINPLNWLPECRGLFVVCIFFPIGLAGDYKNYYLVRKKIEEDYKNNNY